MPKSSPDNYVVNEAGCWIWKGAKGNGGYGYCKWGEEKKAHRAQYVKAHGAGSIPKGWHLDHLCRNRDCINPAHLEPVTPAENTQRGSSAKVCAKDVIEIRNRFSAGESQVALAKEYGVGFQAISGIVRGNTWRDIAGPISLKNKSRMATRLRLDNTSVDELRRLYVAGSSRKQLSVKFSISQQHVGRIISGKQRQNPTGENANGYNADLAPVNGIAAIGGSSSSLPV